MRLPTVALPSRKPPAPPTAPRRQLLTGWGRTSPTASFVHRPDSAAEIAAELAADATRGVIARGLGRSYGDLAQNAGGVVLDLTGMKAIRALDPETGLLTCEGGCSLAAIIAASVPHGWFLPVVPGTRHVTVGGAIACDVHGKNHHLDGSFGDHVSALRLLTPGGEIVDLDPVSTPELFRATVGGLGLTGVILEATIQLIRVQTGAIRLTTDRTASLEETMELLTTTDHLHRYSVAWIDCAARGRHFGRSLLLRGDHARLDDLSAERRQTALTLAAERTVGLPPWASFAPLIRSTTIAAFNELYYRAAREGDGAIQPLGGFFFPLDAVQSWNRIYGASGFLQYQFVVPFGAEAVLLDLVRTISDARRPPALVVLKRFGSSHGMLSFPTPGWTVALDIPLPSPGLAGLLERADDLVVANGGRVYLAKDSRLRPDRLPAMYPNLEAWQEIRTGLDPTGRMQSDLARRLGVTRQPVAATR